MIMNYSLNYILYINSLSTFFTIYSFIRIHINRHFHYYYIRLVEDYVRVYGPNDDSRASHPQKGNQKSGACIANFWNYQLTSNFTMNLIIESEIKSIRNSIFAPTQPSPLRAHQSILSFSFGLTSRLLLLVPGAS